MEGTGEKLVGVHFCHPILNRVKISRIWIKLHKGNPLFTLNNATIEIPIHNNSNDSHADLHVETLQAEYGLQTPTNSPIASTISEKQELTKSHHQTHYQFNHQRKNSSVQLQSLGFSSFRTYCLLLATANGIWKQVISW